MGEISMSGSRRAASLGWRLLYPDKTARRHVPPKPLGGGAWLGRGRRPVSG
jgi:hypothetical protein